MSLKAESRIFALRVPEPLHRELESIARRDSISVSATVRRLISVALRTEESRGQQG